MRKALAKVLALSSALAAAVGTPAQAGFHHRVGTYPCAVVTPSPSIYGAGYAVAPCPPNPVPGCWLARHLCPWHFSNCAGYVAYVGGTYGCGEYGYGLHARGYYRARGFGYGAGCNGCGGAAGCDSCGAGGCETSVGGEASAATPSGERITNEKVISDVPAAGEPASEAPPAPSPDQGVQAPRDSAFRLTGLKQDQPGVAEFNRGVGLYRSRQLNEALAAFEAAIALEDNNAMYHYYLAMTLFGLNGAEAGQEELNRAVVLEEQAPIADWGKRMQREQGRVRAWVEKARRDAGLVK